MAHDHMDMSMGSMSAAPGIPPLDKFPQYYYAVIGAVVGVGTAVNIYNKLLERQRLSAAAKGDPTPAKPKSWISSAFATSFAIAREASHASIRIPLPKSRFLPTQIRTPTVGPMALIIANVVTLIVLCFYGFNTRAFVNFENIGYRTGFISAAQLPLIFLLAGKNNIIGFLTGVSHERLNWLHRWVSRCLLLTTTIHFGYWLSDWWPYGDFAAQKIKTDAITKRGLIAWCVLVWIVFSSMTPIRGWHYELFVLQHLVSFAVFIGFVYIHTPAEVHPYIWIPVGLFFFDRVVRALYILYTNISFFHPKARKAGDMKGVWACRATFKPLPYDTTRITIRNPPNNWSPGQYVFLSCHGVVPLQSHPFTIASIPADGKMEFYVKAEKGGTRKIFNHAEKSALTLPTHRRESATDIALTQGGMKSVAIEGPYGRIRNLRQFDSVILFAGTTGATFTMPLMRDIVAAWTSKAACVTSHIRFVWVVKSKGQLSWFTSQLSDVVESAQLLRSDGLDVKVDMSIYVTCDDEFTEEHSNLLKNWEPETHGKVEEVRGPVENSATDEKKGGVANNTQVREVESRLTDRDQEQSAQPKGACGEDGECCCRGTVEDEDAITGAGAGAGCCCCGNAEDEASSSAPARNDLTEKTGRASSLASSARTDTSKFLLNPRIALFGGRPQCTNIIRKSLEQALGESAVVVCGPKGLVQDVRAATVSLSDERAVHKGTGAQGIFLHTESFGY